LHGAKILKTEESELIGAFKINKKSMVKRDKRP